MSSMLKKSDSKMNNFQVASCTLDASTKIYASRVDRVYMDVFKMASGLGVLPGRKRQSPGGEDDDDADGDGNGVANKKMKKIKRGPKKSIVKTEESLNAEIESDYRLDPMYMYMQTKFGDSQPGFINFMSRMNVRDDNCELIMFPTESYWQKQEQSSLLSDVALPTIPDLSGKTVSSSFRGLFLNEDDDSLDCMTLFKNNAESDVDLDMEPEVPETFEVTGVDDVAPEEETQVPQKPFSIVDVRNHLASKNQEYSYFNMEKISLWAGPGHWRILPSKKEKLSTTTKNEKKEKKQVELNFTDTEDIPKLFIKGRSLVLSKQTMEKTWSASKITNPLDEHYDISNLTRLFLRKAIKHFGFWQNKEEVAEEEEKEITMYDYNNVNDSQSYCPAVADDDYDPPGDGECDETLKPADDVHTTIGWKLVSPPPKVPRVVIPYAQNEKKLDMKKLKLAMWVVLAHEEPDKENVEPLSSQDREPRSKTECSMLFSEMQRELVRRIPKNMAEDLSVHIAFTALLHLANEKVLCLKGNDSYTDVEITQG
ncbi:condensin complex subunit 2 [Anabrus simplex]|uniref:condensin complex subunit 2 n=1 Tax=Anabrus simplex TaxID=316456 RepID=UPI0035A26DA3